MKKLVLQTLMALSLTAPSLAFAQGEGTNSGGGGNVQRSTRADLEQFVANFLRYSYDNSDFAMGGFEKMPMFTPARLKPDLMAMTKTILQRDSFIIDRPILDYMDQLKFEIVDRPCYEGIKERDASTEFRKGASICLSATLLARFPKAELKNVLLPIVYHEIAHQFGYKEGEAKAFQDLATMYLGYRRMYIDSIRTFVFCWATAALDPKVSREKIFKMKNDLAMFTKKVDELPAKMQKMYESADSDEKTSLAMNCAADATVTSTLMKSWYTGDVYNTAVSSGLEDSEELLLKKYLNSGYTSKSPDKFRYDSIVEALERPATETSRDCKLCKSEQVDPAYITMLAAKSAMTFISQEVNRQQSAIKIGKDD